MMKFHFFMICSLMLLSIRCSSPVAETSEPASLSATLPRVLFVTSGISDESAQPAPGVVVAIQSLSKMGAIVRLEPRDILFDDSRLAEYNIIILSTWLGVHDADRKYSLSYMSDEELRNLTEFVEQGGVIITGDNVGRNYPDGTDRIIVFHELNAENWELSKCFGVSLTEENMTGYGIDGRIPGFIDYDIAYNRLSDQEHELWTLVPGPVTSGDFKILGTWKNGRDSAAAIIENRYGKGIAFMLASSGLLHPGNEGGFWGVAQIESFYQYVINEYNDLYDFRLALNPWPGGYDYAFCVTMNAEGSREQYDRVFRMLEDHNIPATFFVNGLVGKEQKDLLKSKGYPLASSGFTYSNYRELKYPQAIEDIMMNENHWEENFTGFRFPFTNADYWGLLALDEHDYSFESSIGADNLDFIHGSVIPYNIVITHDGFFKSTDILEIAPTYHDDYYFLKMIGEGVSQDSTQLDQKIMIYRRYLENYWKYGVKPYHGMMVFLGHPQFAGFSDSTLAPLRNLLQEVKKDNTWITTIHEAASFRKNLADFRFYPDNGSNPHRVHVTGPDDITLSEVCLNIPGKVKTASVKEGKIRLIEKEGFTSVVFDAFNGQTLTYHKD